MILGITSRGREEPAADVHLAGSRFDPERMYRFWQERAEDARTAGSDHLRAVAEMAWTLQGLPGTERGTERARAFESGLTAVLPEESFAESFARATSDPVGALLPMWRFYLRNLAGEDEVGPFLCNSLPPFIPGASITVHFTGRASGWHLDPNSLDGSVHTGNDGLWWVEASFGDHARGIALSRSARFTRGELLLFTTLAGAVASALADTGLPGGPA